MFACQKRVIVSQFRGLSRFHSSSIQLAGSDSGLFGKFNPWAKNNDKKEEIPVTPAQHTSEEPIVTFNVKYEDKEEFVSWKNKETIKDHEQIESTIKSIVLQHVNNAGEVNWKDLSLKDLNTKFHILKESMKQIGKEIPNYELNQIETTQDVLKAFTKNETSIENMTVYDYLEKNNESLPSNLKFVPRE
ncbi:hypothetical protein G6F46_003051 [Rhizopus delemar]|uniref:Large ribosomal subunit protein mL50 n=3 Tax=Rhizopus TaxID=4842 RepID=I1C412_RHIO9|nr:hypothetical protein RO3G_07897 [Rhizopus delemar RA 99-880]KAG1464822.1 hypothetical protein G6F55_001526 [Rhizopus delemar]KAG1549245.1 hypothetical protein G6F51_003171 [Rhizopus arrhizus]KAG1502240.1 hypothetical protein G6F54_002498 [Rhizopus delemar]KAG1515790.1 hypothetical protein G6F53_002657 [Rhizopus delemar]|eukprot:EIE83192.1 hypothetical protein RO3G_07897 [Rhizopus delemar RA 99-880]